MMAAVQVTIRRSLVLHMLSNPYALFKHRLCNIAGQLEEIQAQQEAQQAAQQAREAAREEAHRQQLAAQHRRPIGRRC
jgi:hypothetical protein